MCFGFGFGQFGLRKKSRYWFQKNLVSEKCLGFGFGKFGIVKKVSVSVSVKILVSSFSVQKIDGNKRFSMSLSSTLNESKVF